MAAFRQKYDALLYSFKSLICMAACVSSDITSTLTIK